MSARAASLALLVGALSAVEARPAPLPPDKAAAGAVGAFDAGRAAVGPDNRAAPSPPCDALTSLRRVPPALPGRPATPAEVERYLQDDKERRQALLVERLLRGPDHARCWASLWA